MDNTQELCLSAAMLMSTKHIPNQKVNFFIYLILNGYTSIVVRWNVDKWLSTG